MAWGLPLIAVCWSILLPVYELGLAQRETTLLKEQHKILPSMEMEISPIWILLPVQSIK